MTLSKNSTVKEIVLNKLIREQALILKEALCIRIQDRLRQDNDSITLCKPKERDIESYNRNAQALVKLTHMSLDEFLLKSDKDIQEILGVDVTSFTHLYLNYDKAKANIGEYKE